MNTQKTTQKTAATPQEELANNYATLCAQIGERHYLIQKLSVEVAQLSKKLDALAPKKPAATN